MPYNYDNMLSNLKISRTELARLVQQATGLSPMAYILQLRLRYACHLLKDTNLSIGEIALSCGFNDTNYFNRLFRQNYLMKAQEYRIQAID